MSSVRLSGSRRFSSEPWQIGQPDLDEGAHLLFEPGLARDFERQQERLARLLRVDALLQPVVPGHKQLLNLSTSFFYFRLFHVVSLTARMRRTWTGFGC
jgi:hypothetical protein